MTERHLWPDDIIDTSYKKLKDQQVVLVQGEKGQGRCSFILELVKKNICNNSSRCNTCNNCKFFETNNHSDIFIVNDKNQSIDKIRSLVAFSQIKPSIHNIKIAIILEADSLNYASLNALLKTLEEPALNVKIFLGAQKKLIPTITSRCYKFILPNSCNKIDYIIKKTMVDETQANNLLKISFNLPILAVNHFEDNTFDIINTIIKCQNTQDWLESLKHLKALDLTKILQTIVIDLIKFKYEIINLNHYNSNKLIAIAKNSSIKKLYNSLDSLSFINKKLAIQTNLHQTACLNQLAYIWFNYLGGNYD